LGIVSSIACCSSIHLRLSSIKSAALFRNLLATLSSPSIVISNLPKRTRSGLHLHFATKIVSCGSGALGCPLGWFSVFLTSSPPLKSLPPLCFIFVCAGQIVPVQESFLSLFCFLFYVCFLAQKNLKLFVLKLPSE